MSSTIERINLSEESAIKLETLTSSHYGYSHRADRIIKSLSGYCCLCPNVATHIVKYKLEDAILIEKYCHECVIKIKKLKGRGDLNNYLL